VSSIKAMADEAKNNVERLLYEAFDKGYNQGVKDTRGKYEKTSNLGNSEKEMSNEEKDKANFFKIADGHRERCKNPDCGLADKTNEEIYQAFLLYHINRTNALNNAHAVIFGL
jgi:hypothetical protein